jgi:predicted transcriptional regulator YdeE
MKPKIVNRDAFRVMGVVGHFDSAGENFGPLWQEYMNRQAQIEPLSAGEGHYGVYLGADHSRPLDYLAGVAVRDEAAAPEGIEARQVPAAQYAVFKCPFQEIGPTYGYIWGEWLLTSTYAQDTDRLGFDFYPPGTTGGPSPIEIWFPVVKKA